MEMTNHEDYLLRALTSSISFGRYVVPHEPFEEEKRNKYTKEAEKISKPGSVAKLKAYFESYHNKIASNKIADGTIYVDQGLVSGGTRKTAHDLNNINGEEGNELVKREPIVTYDLNRNVEGSNEMLDTSLIIDHSTPMITTSYTYNHPGHAKTKILGKEDRGCSNVEGSNKLVYTKSIVDKAKEKGTHNAKGSKELVNTEPIIDKASKNNAIPFKEPVKPTLVTRLLRRISKSSSSKEKKKGNIDSSKSNNSSINGRSTPISANQDTPPLAQTKKDSSINSFTQFIKSRTTKNFVGSKKPTSSSSTETVVGSSKHESKQKSRSSINGASIRPPWR